MRSVICCALSLVLAACATGPQRRAPAATATGAGGVKIGRPYQVLGRTYVPSDDRSYDARGIASWYGPTFHTRPTANGEIYNQNDVTAAHKTLPMPSWVEVTNLDNGRQLVVRINDRGPFVDGRIIDLSLRSAQLLGVDRAGLARVRVRRVFPDGDWARTAAPVVARREAAATPAPVLAGTPLPAAPAPPPPPGADARYVQVAAVTDRGRAEWLAQSLEAFGPGSTQMAPNGLWRVRLGPFAPARAAEILAEIRAGGYPDAQIIARP